MEPYFVNTVSLKENIAPTVTSAKLTDVNKITLTFSEKVNSTDVTTDFELLIGGATVAANDQVSTAAGTGITEVVLTLEKNVTAANIASGLSLKALSTTINVKDTAGNNLRVPADILVTQ